MGFVRHIRSLVRKMEDWQFDRARSVETSEPVTLDGFEIVGSHKAGFEYFPVRAVSARRAIEDLPVPDYADYTFVDLGSGKGRMLFVAAEYPFRKIEGVEFASGLHKQAESNIRRYRYTRQQCRSIESLNIDASDYDFPNEKLVLCLFNPFGPETIQRVMAGLDASLDKYPRHVILLYLYPVYSESVGAMPKFRLYKTTGRYDIYQTDCSRSI